MCSLSTCVMNYHSCLLYQIVLLHCIVNVMSAKQHWEEQLAEIFFQLTIKDLDKWIKLSDQQKDMTVSEQLNLLFDMTMQLYDDCEVWIFFSCWHTWVARWLSGRASDWRSKSRGFEPRGPAVTLLRNNLIGKLFTPYCLCHQAI